MTLLRTTVLVCVVMAGVGTACRRKPQPPKVTINGRAWSVELAMTSEQRYRGLAGRASLANDTGMLFIFPHSKVLDFYMRGCLIPLDIAFISHDMRVMRTFTMQVASDPNNLRVYSSRDLARYALEVPAGQLASADVRPGDTVNFSPEVPGAAKASPDP